MSYAGNNPRAGQDAGAEGGHQPAPQHTSYREVSTPPRPARTQPQKELGDLAIRDAGVYSMEAEQELLGVMLNGWGHVDPIRVDLSDLDFGDPIHGDIYAAAVTVAMRGDIVTPATVKDELETLHVPLDAKGGPAYLIDLSRAGEAVVDPAALIRIIKEKALDRQTLALTLQIRQAIQDHQSPDALLAQLVKARETGVSGPMRAVDGAEFLRGVSGRTTCWWGTGSRVLAAGGQSLIIGGPMGLGKTTLCQQLMLGRAGLERYSHLLGFPITPDPRGVLYIAADRPEQAAESMLRMVGDNEYETISERMTVWKGPLPRMLNDDPMGLVKLARKFDRGTLFVDSLKDVCRSLKDDDGGSAYNIARQNALAEGFDLVELHHSVKKNADRHGNTIDDLYGSTWIGAGAGSVLLLDGRPGDPIVTAYHVKQPKDSVGTLRIEHNNVTGRSYLADGNLDVVAMVRGRGSLTARELAETINGADNTSTDRKKAERNLDALTREGLLVKIPGNKGAKIPNRWEPSGSIPA